MTTDLVSLSGPASSAGRPMPDGPTPIPGGWNRIHLIDAEVARVFDDPAGNPVELFQPAVR